MAAVLEALGLPVRVEQSTRLADTSFGRWLVALVRLSGWAAGPLDRDVLRRVLLAPWCRLDGAVSRGELRRLLRSLRRPRISRTGWDAHVRGHFQQRRDRAAGDVDLDPTERQERLDGATAQEAGLLALTKRLVGVWSGPGAWRALRRLLGEQGEGALKPLSRARVVGPHAAAEVNACLRQLDALVGQPVPEAPAVRVSERLAATGVRSGSLVDVGIRLQTWSTWDGRGAARVVLAGLEAGAGRARRPLAPADRALQGALGGPSPIASSPDRPGSPPGPLPRPGRRRGSAGAAPTTRAAAPSPARWWRAWRRVRPGRPPPPA